MNAEEMLSHNEAERLLSKPKRQWNWPRFSEQKPKRRVKTTKWSVVLRRETHTVEDFTEVV